MFSKLLLTSAFVPAALACLGYEGGLPQHTDHISSDAPIYLEAGEVFDAGWAKYDRGSGACGSGEGGESDAVFVLASGATLRNVIIGKDQMEGVYCLGSCNLEFVWFEDVCEDAISIKEDGAGDVVNIIGGGAFHASDKVIQHNGCGTVNVINFYVEDYGKVYRSCGNCDSQCKRTSYFEGVTAKDGGEVAGINENYGDVATMVNVCADTSNPCVVYDGCEGDCEPSKIGTC